MVENISFTINIEASVKKKKRFFDDSYETAINAPVSEARIQPPPQKTLPDFRSFFRGGGGRTQTTVCKDSPLLH